MLAGDADHPLKERAYGPPFIMTEDSPTQVARMVDAFLREDVLSREETACPYLPGRTACSEGFRLVGGMGGAVYRALMDRRFRRSGHVFYRPVCEQCQQCIPIRVPASSFQPTRSQRRVRRRNADVRVVLGDGVPSAEKHALFAAYLADQHDGGMSGDRASFDSFLYDSPIPGMEFCYYVGPRLAGVSLLDVTPGALSSVYMFFDPAEGRRSLGTFSVLWELDYCRAARIAYYYLGYWVPGSKTMAYKARFRPAETLDAGGCWRPLADTVVD